jgi:hypothetical protein
MVAEGFARVNPPRLVDNGEFDARFAERNWRYTMPGKKSSAAYRADRAAARDAAYKYVHNPFEEGTRLHRLCENARRHKQTMDFLFDEMEEIYGPAGVKKPVIDNIPGTFKKAPAAELGV